MIEYSDYDKMYQTYSFLIQKMIEQEVEVNHQLIDDFLTYLFDKKWEQERTNIYLDYDYKEDKDMYMTELLDIFSEKYSVNLRDKTFFEVEKILNTTDWKIFNKCMQGGNIS